MNNLFNWFKPLIICLVLWLLIFIPLNTAHALMLELSLNELTEKAEYIIVGEVESVSSSWDNTRSNIYTSIVIKVADELKNENYNDAVTVVVPGGEVDGITQVVSDIPVFEPGERAIFFLNQKPANNLPHKQALSATYELYGKFQGKIDIFDHEVSEMTINEVEGKIQALDDNNQQTEEESFDFQYQSQWWDLPDFDDGSGSSDDDQGYVSNDQFVWLGIRWNGSSPNVPFYVNASSDRTNHIRAAAETWSSAGADFSFNFSGTHSRNGRASLNDKNEIMWYDLGTNYILALATIWFDGSEILEADMVFNTRFAWATTGFSGHDVQTVALHEFGHWLGLNHSPEYGSIMYGQIKGTQRYLHAVDIAGIKYIYGEADSSDPVAPDEPETVIPVNNYFSDRTKISRASGYTTGSNVNATRETDEPKHDGIDGGQSVWWEWIAPASGTVEINTRDSNFDTILAVYTGSNVSDLNAVVSNHNYSDNGYSKVSFEAAEGASYKIAVDGWGSSTGSIALNWELNPDDELKIEEPELNSLAIEINGEGTTSPEPGFYTYEEGTEITLEAAPAENWDFSKWVINGNEIKAAVTSIVIDRDTSVTAVFNIIKEDSDSKPEPSPDSSSPSPPKESNPQQSESSDPEPAVKHSVRIKVQGEGTTIPGPGSYQYEEHEEIDIMAKPAQGWRFSRWIIDDLELFDVNTTISMIGSREATAHFTRIIAGDVTGDSQVTVSDIVIVVHHTLGIEAMSAEQVYIADVNGDGVIDVRDISLLMRYALGIIDYLPGY